MTFDRNGNTLIDSPCLSLSLSLSCLIFALSPLESPSPPSIGSTIGRLSIEEENVPKVMDLNDKIDPMDPLVRCAEIEFALTHKIFHP